MKKEMSENEMLMERDHQLNSLQGCIDSLKRIHSSKKHVIWWSDIEIESTMEEYHEEITQTFNYLNEKIEFKPSTKSKMKKVI